MHYSDLHYRELALRATEGDERAFRELYDRHAASAVRTAYLITGDHGLAEDAVQEAFVQIHRHLAQLSEARADAPWIRRLVVRAAIDRLRRRRWWLLPFSVLPEEHGPGSTEDFRSDQRTDLEAALRHLGVRQRAALVMRFYHGLTEVEVAAELEVPVGTVKSWMHRAFARLRQMRELEGYAARGAVQPSPGRVPRGQA